MKKIALALLSVFLITPCMANIHINPDVVAEVIATHFPKKQVDCIREYNAQLKASNGSGIAAAKLWNVCAAGGLDIKKAANKEKCRTFVNDLTYKGTITFYAACGKDKKRPGAICVNDFAAITVNMQQAQGLAKLYAHNKSDNTIQCRSKPRIDTNTIKSINPYAIGMSATINTPYLQCTSYNSNKFYEFAFNNVDGNIDAINHKNFKTGICKIFGSKFTQKDLYGYKWDICSDIKDENACNNINKIISTGNIGYIASWGPSGYMIGDRGYKITSTSLPYCVLTESVLIGNDGYLLSEHTAFGLDGRTFLNAGIQRKGSKEIKEQIRAYVENTMGKANVKSFSCEDIYHTIKLKGRSGKDDMLRCTINGETVEFFFDDLSEAWGTYDKSGREAMNCIAWGGTFTGKKCIGLDEKMCYKVRDANAQSCPECKKIQWNKKTNICELPASVDATNLKRGLTYTAIVGGAVASVVITIGTAGTGGVTAGTALIMMVETLGMGIELGAQVNIDNKADKFFVDSANCNYEYCAKKLVKEYLTELARIGRDLTDAEADATDKEMARLIGIIPTNSDWWIDNLKTDDGKSLLEKADDGKWTASQVWRAIGIGMQFTGVASSITGWIIKKTGYLEKTLDRTSKILLASARTAEKNIVKVDKLDDVSKEWYKLWQEYAPKNQTLDQFKAMTNGDLDEMKQMVKNWTPRSKKSTIIGQIDKQTESTAADLGNNYSAIKSLMEKYNIDAWPGDPDKLAQLYKEHPDLEQAAKTRKYTQSEFQKLQEAKVNYTNTNYSTYDPEFTRVSQQYQQKISDIDTRTTEAWNDYQKTNPSATPENFYETETYKKLVEENYAVRKEYQFEVAEKFQLENLGNVVNERADEFAEIIANNPEVQTKLNDFGWGLLSDQERADVAQQILNEYATKTSTSKAFVGLDYKTTSGGYYTPGTNNITFNPNAQLKTPDGMVETMAHEHGHLIDYTQPNEGAMGEQFSHYAKQLYSNNNDDGYRIALTEQSSYKIGPNVSHEATGTTHYVYGKEYNLETAKEKEQYLQTLNKYDKKLFDKRIDNYSGIVTGSTAISGMVTGAATTIIKENNKTKDEK